MQLDLGQKIRELRHRDGRTQEALAEALGVTSQAVSRWEANGGYPDMEMIPSIANYFGVAIDELFGYKNGREEKIDAIIEKVDSYGIQARGDDMWVDECVAILRDGLTEFPGNERLLIALAETLSEAGWRRHGERIYYDEEGFQRHDHDLHRENPFWNESIKICEQLAASKTDNAIFIRAVTTLVLLYRNIGEYEKARAFAQKMPELKYCRELQLTAASDGKEEAKYIGEFLLKAARKFSDQLICGLIANSHNFEGDLPIEKIKGIISLFTLICDDGNFGILNGELISLNLYLSRLQWERGYHDDAFRSLDAALHHARELEKVVSKSEHRYTAPLVAFVKEEFETPVEAPPGFISAQIPDDWPAWCYPDYSKVECEIKADPRWAKWVKRTQG
ncbi:MAG: helix-turn-helix domain-containing protein [Clostridia bacterium]|nr:helix-turn-helix domain-containing protein [Clostridia bacterium]